MAGRNPNLFEVFFLVVGSGRSGGGGADMEQVPKGTLFNDTKIRTPSTMKYPAGAENPLAKRAAAFGLVGSFSAQELCKKPLV